MKSLREHYLHAAIADLHYDFTAFKIRHFLQHFQARRTQPLEVKRYPFQPDVFAYYYRNAIGDYIVVNATLHPVHQLHSVLHEVAHLHLQHTGVRLRDAMGEALSQEFGLTSEIGHVRGIGFDNPLNREQEAEAERFVQLIRREITAANRLYELQTPSSLPEMRPYLEGLDLTR